MKQKIIVAIISGVALIIVALIGYMADSKSSNSTHPLQDSIQDNSIKDLKIEGSGNSIIQGNNNSINNDSIINKKENKNK